MSGIPVDKLIAIFRKMYDEHWRYTWGHAAEGDVDCSGAYVYAYRLFDRKIPHGSNAIARGYVEGIEPISNAKPGYAAFKLKKPGQSGYDLPEKYRKGGAAYNGDLNDYYHIGLVDETGQYVLEAQGTKAGFQRTPIKKWHAAGRLCAVDYTVKEEIPMTEFVVTAANGEPVRVRQTPGGATIAKLTVGTKLLAGDEADGWRPVVFDTDRQGYMKAEFLSTAQSVHDASETPDEGGEDNNSPAFVRTLTTDEFNRLCDARDQLEGILELIKSIVGVG